MAAIKIIMPKALRRGGKGVPGVRSWLIFSSPLKGGIVFPASRMESKKEYSRRPKPAQFPFLALTTRNSFGYIGNTLPFATVFPEIPPNLPLQREGRFFISIR
jgi:hypothetical protein